MSLAKDLELQSEAISLPPDNLWSDEPPLESDLHLLQIKLFLDCLNWWWKDRNDFYASGNLTIYYSAKQIKSRDFRGPDFFVVLGVERRPRKSWIVWEEDGKTPNLIIEVLSDTTANVDRGVKKQIYQDVLKVHDYFWFDPSTLEFQGFHLVNGQYQSLEANSEGWLWSQQLKLYLGIHQNKLRFFTSEGQLLPTLEETAEAAEKRAKAAEKRAEHLAERLKALGVDVDE
ncbi:MAG: Uma2 family endonuclease [Cyanothece sp. SIO1E1]|nr:Uma2 family endonuclease [Cyanothece sp. SIO1E1]